MRSRLANRYPRELKESIARRYLSSELSYRELAEEVGADPSSVRTWVQSFKEHGTVAKRRRGRNKSKSKSTGGRSAADKLRLIFEAKGLSDDERGAFLRREGVHDADLERWEADAIGGLDGGRATAGQQLRIRQLEKKSAKQTRRLREAEALLELQKKVQALWGDADDDTDTKSE